MSESQQDKFPLPEERVRVRGHFNLDRLIRENIKTLKPYSSARDEYKDFADDMVFLDANENPFENGVNRYPDPQQRSLKSVLAEQKGIQEDKILLGNGSDEVLDLIFRAFCEPNEDNIITLPPTYGMYKVLAGTNAIQNKEILLTERFQPNIREILEAIDSNTKLLFLCSPNNPTGNLFDSRILEKLLTEFQGLVVLDEAYIDFAPADSWINRLAEFPNLIVTQTLSKAYGLAGIRLGICFASATIIQTLNRIKPPYNVNELTQQKALERLSNTRLVATEVDKILSEREDLRKTVTTIKFVDEVFQSDSNFILVRVDNANLRYEQLIAKGVVIRNRSSQPLCDNTLRFTVGTKEENQKLINALKELT